MTNREKINRMTNQEMADYLCKNTQCWKCPAGKYCSLGHTGYIDWLEAEAEEEELCQITS